VNAERHLLLALRRLLGDRLAVLGAVGLLGRLGAALGGLGRGLLLSAGGLLLGSGFLLSGLGNTLGGLRSSARVRERKKSKFSSMMKKMTKKKIFARVAVAVRRKRGARVTHH